MHKNLSMRWFIGVVAILQSVMSDSLQLHGLQHTRLPCPLPSPRACSNSCPLSWWCHPTILSSVVPFSLWLQSFPTTRSFLISQFFASGGYSISPSNEYSGLISFQIDWFDLLAVQRTLKSLLQHHSSKAPILQHSAFFMVQLSHAYLTTGKTKALTRWTFVGKVMSLLFNMLSGLIITFLPRSKHLIISWLQSPYAMILKPKKIKSVIVSIVSPSICHEVMRPDVMIFNFWMLSFKPAYSLSSFTFTKKLLSSSLLSSLRVMSSAYLRLLIFFPATLIPACASSSLAFNIMDSAYKLNKQGDNLEPWCTPFPICNQSVIPHLVLTIASWAADKFLRRQVRWSSIPISWRIFHSLLWSTQSKNLA